MRPGRTWLIASALLTCTACLSDRGKLEIRSVDRGLKAGQEPIPFRIAEARGHLALGNVALALEGFRKAAREDPASIEALAGIADCYDRLGRFDLSRRNYEMALAITPRHQGLLTAFGASLQVQGRTAEAEAVRRELAALARPAPLREEQVQSPSQNEIVARPGPIPALPEHAAPVGHSVTIALSPVRPAGAGGERKPESQALQVFPVGQSVTITLPPLRPAPAAQASKSASAARLLSSPRPRLMRLSLTEVALVTSDGPRWKRPEALRLAARKDSPDPMELRLLNAARVNKLAARTRTYLNRYGWKEIDVGDAAVVRSRSLILYPKGAQAAARRLSTRLGFAVAPRNDVRQLTILLGHDAAAHPALRPSA